MVVVLLRAAAQQGVSLCGRVVTCTFLCPSVSLDLDNRLSLLTSLMQKASLSENVATVLC